jgi:hypothetical protein
MIILISLLVFYVCVLFLPSINLTKVFSFVTFVQDSLYPKDIMFSRTKEFNI